MEGQAAARPARQAIEEDEIQDREPPVKLWGMDPLFTAHVRLSCYQLTHLKESKTVAGMFFLNVHPVQKAHIVGYIVSIAFNRGQTPRVIYDGESQSPI